MSAARDFKWPQQAINQMQRLRAAGVSLTRIAAQIGAAFDVDLTRGAIAGKINRLDWPRLPHAPREIARALARPHLPGRQKGKPATAPSPQRQAIPKPESRLSIRKRKLAMARDLAPKPNYLTLLQLRFDSCRFPYGEPGADSFRFCGARVEEAGASYCDAHQAVCFTPYARSRRQSERAESLPA
jgi:GcrA cell cycle regulator